MPDPLVNPYLGVGDPVLTRQENRMCQAARDAHSGAFTWSPSNDPMVWWRAALTAALDAAEGGRG